MVIEDTNMIDAPQETKFNPLNEPLKFEIEERIKGEIVKDGELKKLEVKGEGFVTLVNPQKKNAVIVMTVNSKPKFNTSKINKTLFKDKGIIQAEVRILFYNYKNKMII